MRTERIRCPRCNGVVNKMWFSHLLGNDAVFICECWSGDFCKRSYHHIFKVQFKLLDVKENYEEILAQQIKEALTNGWETTELAAWSKYVNEEIKPHWSELAYFLEGEASTK